MRALDAGRCSDLLDFFDRDAFPDNPMRAGCTCLFHEFRGDLGDWGRRTGAGNHAYHGPLERYVAAGFSVAREAKRVVVVRRPL